MVRRVEPRPQSQSILIPCLRCPARLLAASSSPSLMGMFFKWVLAWECFLISIFCLPNSMTRNPRNLGNMFSRIRYFLTSELEHCVSFQDHWIDEWVEEREEYQYCYSLERISSKYIDFSVLRWLLKRVLLKLRILPVNERRGGKWKKCQWIGLR